METNSVSVLGWIARRPRPLDIQHGSCWRTAVCTRPLVRDSNSYHLPRSAGPNKLHTKTQPATLHNSFASPGASLAGLSPFNYSPAILPPGVARFSSSRGGSCGCVFLCGRERRAQGHARSYAHEITTTVVRNEPDRPWPAPRGRSGTFAPAYPAIALGVGATAPAASSGDVSQETDRAKPCADG